MEAFGAALVDLLVQLAVRPELVGAEDGDLGTVRVPRGLGRMRHDEAEAPTVAEEILELQLLAPDHGDAVFQPGLIDRREALVVERLHVDPGNLPANVRTHRPNLQHRIALLCRLFRP